MKINNIIQEYLMEATDYSNNIENLRKQIQDTREIVSQAVEDETDPDKKEQIRKRGQSRIESLQKRIEDYRKRAKAEREREAQAKK